MAVAAPVRLVSLERGVNGAAMATTALPVMDAQSVAVILPAPPVKSVRNPQANVAASPESLDRCVIGVKVDSTTSQLPAVLRACAQPLQHQSSVVMQVCVPVLQMSPVTSVIAVGVASTI